MNIFQKLTSAFKKKDYVYPIGALLPSWLSSQPVYTDWSTEHAVREGFKSSHYVYACIQRIMKAAASVPWLVRDSKGQELVDNPLSLLIKKPNPFMSFQDLIEILTAHLYLGGNGLWLKNKANGITTELWPIGPDGIKPVPSATEFIKHYKYQKGNVTKIYKVEEILHVLFPDPNNVYWGMSPLQAGAKIVDTEVDAINWNKVALQNRAVADGVFTFKQPLTKDQWEAARAMIREQHQGSDTARTPWVLGSDADWKQMSLSPVEMDFIESRKLSREEICSIFGVPPPLVGIYEHTPLANIKEARKIFWLDTIIPYLDDLQSSFNLSLAPEFGEGIQLKFDISNVEALREVFKDLVETGYKLFQMGVPFDQINQRLQLGLDKVPSGKIGYLPSSLLPTSMTVSGEGLKKNP